MHINGLPEVSAGFVVNRLQSIHLIGLLLITLARLMRSLKTVSFSAEYKAVGGPNVRLEIDDRLYQFS